MAHTGAEHRAHLAVHPAPSEAALRVFRLIDQSHFSDISLVAHRHGHDFCNMKDAAPPRLRRAQAFFHLRARQLARSASHVAGAHVLLENGQELSKAHASERQHAARHAPSAILFDYLQLGPSTCPRVSFESREPAWPSAAPPAW
eukprot:CAMPEP_0170347992 /NCGR_PEP_ID=MMETSP0116_2-20130129/75262_1 /TAXON_ID=400756 /ORGANISM="Durinskia baltica, Strain CSIRO CS-38" /LENGTH=144 /DNA_ID=CAMNT_0010601827 /DNA_START=139 /DNA_END=570 /DNA_ORIENTATION=-